MSSSQAQQSQIPENMTSSQKKKLFTFKRTTLYLENKGSIARDHLANERTFLAWLRTALSFSGIGIAISQLFKLSVQERTMKGGTMLSSSPSEKSAKVLSVTFILLGMVFLLLGILRYFNSQMTMTKGRFPATRLSIIVAAFLTIAILVGIIVMLVIDS
ncbi:1419_t:CDS:2 [Ambispora gerdemannii]|uniref:1419_t:CDS:1 n=1 Tax=Ambispora gerdemannii TaxID=144530 RepID=A0A9N9H9H5_9GLOM|nr:1419_t:CDS:2 [Ambispora gerdemannii]